ncbi:hypothetical protein MD484_g8840, partial [Candolleomyces efflorescens]
MILFLLALNYFSGIVFSAPVNSASTTTLQSQDGTHTYIYTINYRSLTQIVTNCISTILLCTWVSIHPDIHGYKSNWRQRLGRKLELFIWALLMPELVTLWAFNQWFGARHICKALENNGVTDILSLELYIWRWDDRKKDLRTKAPTEALGRELTIHRELESLPSRADEITDRSKTDALSKMIVIVQTTWFTAQYIARACQGLAITELETVTLAYTALSGVMSAFWWSKPLDIQCPLVIDLSPGWTPTVPTDSKPDDLKAKSTSGPTMLRSIASKISTGLQSAAKYILNPRKLNPLPILRRIPRILWKGIVYCINSAVQLMAYTEYNETHRFKTFSKDGDSVYYAFSLAVSFMASLFGAIHCISWSFTFPSLALQTTWRVCAMFITFSPLTMAVFPVFSWCFGGNLPSWRIPDWLKYPLWFITCFLLPPLYVSARIILTVIAFLCLSDIPATGYQTIEWASFIPHI